MMQRAGLVVLVVLNGTFMLRASEGSLSEIQFVLQRIVNPKQELLGGGGTHNSIHFSCLGKQPSHGFIDSGKEHDGINTVIPTDRNDVAILLSIAKHRCAVFHDAPDARFLVVRKFVRDSTKDYRDEKVTVDGLAEGFSGRCPVVLEIRHGAKIVSKCTQAAVSKVAASSSSSPANTVVIHMPPESSQANQQVSRSRQGIHGLNCPCASCVQKLPPPPSYSAPIYPTIEEVLPYGQKQTPPSQNPYRQ